MRLVVVVLLVVSVFASALQVVMARHQGRKLFVELQELERIRDELNEEWGRLQLEQATWGTHSRVEQLAISKLDMTRPDTKAIVLVTP